MMSNAYLGAAVLEGLSNPEAIAEQLDEWGCEYA
jgi:hypothetical protein